MAFDTAPAHARALTTAHKAIAAFLSFLGTFLAVLIANLNGAAGWIDQLLIGLGALAGTGSVYVTRNRPKR